MDKTQPITMCKFKSGRSGMPAAVFRSFSRPYADRESHANPYVTNNFPLYASVKKDNKWHYTNIKIEKNEKNQN